MTGRPMTGVARALTVVFASSTSALAIGLAKNVLAAYYFGTSGAMDAYLLALVLPDLVMQLAGTGAFNFIPLFARERERSEADAWGAAARMTTYWFAVLVGLGLAALALSGTAIHLVAPGLDDAGRREALGLTRILLIMAATLGAGRILGVVLHAERRFLAAGLAGVTFQLTSIAYLVAFHETGIRSLAWAQACGGWAQLLVAAGALFARRRSLQPSLDFRSAPVRRLIRLSLPVYAGDTGDKVNVLVTRAFASLVPAGAVSALQYAFMPVEAVHRAVAFSLSTALFPFLSRSFASGDPVAARTQLARAGLSSAMVFVPLAAALWLSADLLVVMLFERGSFGVASTLLTASSLRYYAPSVAALAFNELIGSSFHARQDTWTPLMAGLLRIGFNAVLCSVLLGTLAHNGIALATTVSLYLKLAFLLFALSRLYPAAEWRRHRRAALRIVLAAATMCAVAYPVAVFGRAPEILDDHAAAALVVLAGLCLSGYAAGLWLFARRLLLVNVALVRRAVRPRRLSVAEAA